MSKVIQPLYQCTLRCDKFLRSMNGGTYGYTRSGGTKFHGGIDLYADVGMECLAMGDGVIEWVSDFGTKGWGKAVLLNIKSQKRWILYAHLSKALVIKGTPIVAGQIIGETGISGNGDSQYPHLHLEVWTDLRAGMKGTHETYRENPLALLGLLPYQNHALEIIERQKTV